MSEDTYAVITGATSGIGAEFARQLAQRGYNLILSGRRKAVIEKVAHDINNTYKRTVSVIIADFTKKSDLNKFIEEIKKIPHIEVLINNAGFGFTKQFLKDEYKNQETMITVHVDALTEITHAVVQKFMKKKKGIIINVSSMAPMLASPASPLYAATKAYINTFSETLFMLLKPYQIKVQALCPGFTKTDFHAKLGMTAEQCKNLGIIRWMSAEKVVRLSLKALRKNKVIVVPGFLNNVLIFLIKILRSIPGGFFYSISSRNYKKMEKKLFPKDQDT